jgi:hypothetical protein
MVVRAWHGFALTVCLDFQVNGFVVSSPAAAVDSLSLQCRNLWASGPGQDRSSHGKNIKCIMNDALNGRVDPSSNQDDSGEAVVQLAAELRDSLRLYDRFDRWRYMQRLLDNEIQSDQINQLLYVVLDGALRYPRPVYGSTGETGSPDLTKELESAIVDALVWSEARDPSKEKMRVPLLGVADKQQNNEELLSLLENQILPRDEEVLKGLWDIVGEIHGREATKIDSRSAEWLKLCLASRVLLCYDFLTLGVLSGPVNADAV